MLHAVNLKEVSTDGHQLECGQAVGRIEMTYGVSHPSLRMRYQVSFLNICVTTHGPRKIAYMLRSCFTAEVVLKAKGGEMLFVEVLRAGRFR